MVLYFGNFDKDSDGFIDVKEAEALLPYINGDNSSGGSKEKPTPEGAITGEMFVGYLDKDNDKKISKDEASAELKPYFDQHDLDNDGYIDAKEAEVIADYVNQQNKN